MLLYPISLASSRPRFRVFFGAALVKTFSFSAEIALKVSTRSWRRRCCEADCVKTRSVACHELGEGNTYRGLYVFLEIENVVLRCWGALVACSGNI